MIWLALLLSSLAVAVGWLRERRAGTRVWWRHLALLAMGGALAILILQPTRRVAVDLQTAVVLTAGATPELIEDEGVSIGSSTLSVALPGAVAWSATTRRAPDLATFLRQNPQVDHLRLVGAGVEPWDLEELRPSLELLGSFEGGLGVGTISWQRRLQVGEELQLTGSVHGLSRGSVVLDLVGPGGPETGLEVEASAEGGPVAFTLPAKPPGVGRFLYELATTDSEGVRSSVGSVDVEVISLELPRILWLEDAPSFETKHLKRWLADLGGALAIRSRVSSGRFRFEFHNLDRFPIGRLDADLLARFDLLVAEQRAWDRLSSAEKTVVAQAVEDTGLGALVRLDPPDQSEKAPPWPWGFSGVRIPEIEQLLVRAPGPSGARATPVEAPPFELSLRPGMTPLFTDGFGRVLAMSRPAGRGTVGVTLMRRTYPWVLEGYPEAQRSYWRRVMNALARPDPNPTWLVAPGPILVDEPLELTLVRPQDSASIPEAYFGVDQKNRSRVALRQDPLVRSRWTATVWPAEVGWHRLEAEGATTQFYVGASDDWSRWRQERRWRATRLAASLSTGRQPESQPEIDVPVPRLPFFLLLLGSLGLLWLDERRGSRSPTAPRRPVET